MNKKNFAPTLYPLDRNINRVWFVKYYDANGAPQKKFGKLAKLGTVEERLKEGKRLIKLLQEPVKKKRKQRGNFAQMLYNLVDANRHTLKKKSYQSYTSIINVFTTWYKLGDDPSGFIKYLYEQEYHVNYINKVNERMNSWFNALVKNKQTTVNPFAEIVVRKIKARSKLPFHTRQVELLKEKISKEDPQLWDAIELEFYMYFRPKEIRLLRVDDIIFDEMQINLRAEVAKDKEDLLKAIPAPLQQRILKYQAYPPNYYLFSHNGAPGKCPLSANVLNNRHRAFMKALNFGERYTLYSWVHTGIKMAAMAGIPIKQLQIQKGHSDLKMFDRYMKDLHINDCRELVNNFPVL